MCTVGIIGGKFLERGPIAKPKRSESDPTSHYQAEDLYIGSRVEFNKHKFVFIDADEYALRYMEKHSDQVGTNSYSQYRTLASYCNYYSAVPSCEYLPDLIQTEGSSSLIHSTCGGRFRWC